MYLLFAGEEHYNAGGIDDLAGVFETLAGAQEALEEENDDWAEIALVEGNMLKLVRVLYDGDTWGNPLHEVLFTTGKEKAS